MRVILSCGCETFGTRRPPAFGNGLGEIASGERIGRHAPGNKTAHRCREAIGGLARRLAVVAVAWLAIALAAAEGKALAARPNVILVMSDNQGFGDLGCHGNPWLRTPNLDALHAESVRFTDFHSSPSCAPTRAGLMTGRYPNRTGVWHTIQGRSLLHRNERTIADVFADAGYATALFGKWHLGDNYPFRAEDRGFSEVLRHGGGGIGQTPDYWNNSYYDGVLWYNGKPTPTRGYSTDVYFEYAIRCIDQRKADGKPFFIYVPTTVMHQPRQVPDYYVRPYRYLGEDLARYYGMIANFDDNIGRLRSCLRKNRMEENTIFVFLSDNGPAHPGDMRYTAGMKGEAIDTVYEASHRVPCFMHWPAGGVQGGRDVEALTSHIDLLPTLLDLCGIEHKGGQPLDGVSLRPLIENRGKAEAFAERIVVVDSQRVVHPIKWRNSCVMMDRWRLINGKELYDIQTDVGQKNDVAAKHPAVVSKLRGAYEDWWKSLSAVHDRKAEIIIGNAAENPSRLTCHDWYSDENVANVDLTWHEQLYPAWNQAMVRAATRFSGGYWAVQADQEGEYEFEVRRWPREVDQPLRAPLAPGPSGPGEPVFRETRGEAIDIRAVVLRINGTSMRMDVQDERQTHCTFKAHLNQGSQRLEAIFVDAAGREFGAYYLYVLRNQ